MYVVKNILKCDLYHSQMLVLSKKNYLKNKIAFKKKISLHLLLLRSNTNKIQSILHPADFVATGRCLNCCRYASEIPNLFNWYINYLSLL